MTGEPKGQFPALHLAHDPLVEVALEGGIELLVGHGVAAVSELAPELGHLRGLADLELKLVVRPL